MYAVPMLFSYYMASLFFPDVFGLLVYFTNFNRQVSGALGKVPPFIDPAGNQIFHIELSAVWDWVKGIGLLLHKKQDCHFFHITR